MQGNARKYKEIRYTMNCKAIQGNTRKHKEMQGNIRKCKELQGNTRKCKEIPGNPRKHGNSRKYKEI